MSDSNDKNNKNDKKPNQDPFDFFKLSPESGNKKGGGGKKGSSFPFWAIILVVVVAVGIINMILTSQPDNLIPFSDFKAMIQNGQITSVDIGETYFTGYLGNAIVEETTPSGLNLFSTPAANAGNSVRTAGILTESFLQLLDTAGVSYKVVAKQNGFLTQLLLNLVIPFGFIFRKMGGGLGGSIFSAGSSRASAVEEGSIVTRFADVAGVDEAKEELVEVVDFLKSPEKYTEIGGKIPKGVLSWGLRERERPCWLGR